MQHTETHRYLPIEQNRYAGWPLYREKQEKWEKAGNFKSPGKKYGKTGKLGFTPGKSLSFMSAVLFVQQFLRKCQHENLFFA